MRTSLKEKAYDYILEEILSGRFASNQAIIENDLCEKLKISRTPVREAIKQLEAEGLVVKYVDRGAFVKEITLTDIDEICQLRKLFEVEALKYSISRITAGEIADCRKLLLDLEKKPDSWSFFKADKSFHKLVIKYCPNTRLLYFYRNLEKQIERFQRLLAEEENHYAVIQKQHLKLLEILETRDYERTSTALSYHIDDIRQSLTQICITQMTQSKFPY